MNTIVIALGYAFCWGVGVTLTKIALGAIAPTTLLIVQLFSSVLFLTTLCAWKGYRLPFSFHQLKAGYAGLFEPALAYMFGIFGIQKTSASSATLIGSSEVILTILIAAVVLGEKLTPTKLLLAGVSVSGVLMLMVKDASSDSSSLVGDVLVLLGTIFAVFYALCSKHQIQSANPLQLTLSQQIVGFLAIALCFGTLSFLHPSYEINIAGIAPQFWLLAIGSGIMQYALAFLLYLIALQKIPVSHAAFYIALIPVFGVVSAVVLIGEQPSPIQWFGGLLVVGSSYFANRLEPVHE